MTDRRIDDAIDRAVREIMSVGAAEQTTARVLARLESKARPTPWFRLGAAASLAAAALAAFVFVRSREAAPGSRRVDQPVRPPIASALPAPGQPAKPGHAPKPDEPLPVRRVPVKVTRAVTAAVVEVDVEPPFDMDPLGTLDPIAVAPIEHGAIGPARLTLAPLAPITEVHVEPLIPRGERDGTSKGDPS